MENFTTAGLHAPRPGHLETLHAEDVISPHHLGTCHVPGGLQPRQSPPGLLWAQVVAALCHHSWDIREAMLQGNARVVSYHRTLS